MRTIRINAVLIILPFLIGPKLVSADENPDFFEKSIRPILIDKCHECHGPKKQESGLRLDHRDALIEGGDRGPTVDLDDPTESLLLQALQYDLDDLKMPPDGKLKDAHIEAFETWLEKGATWPPSDHQVADRKKSDEQAKQKAIRKATERKQHWAFASIHQPPIPEVADSNWPSNPIDRFVLAKLERQGITPSPKAANSVLVRRAFFDLLGLPPKYADIERFNADDASNAFEKLVDRLLKNRHYGERWARHWLDVSRYADTKGYIDGGNSEFPFAYTYRDYVIRAFNEDLPFDAFVLDQLTADQRIYADHHQWRLAGMGFLTTGRQFNLNYPDIVDDQIDVITRGFMGLTVSCARCHDHKYDPIFTTDYYSLYGIIASSVEPTHPNLPLTQPPQDRQQLDAYLKKVHAQDQAYRQKFSELHAKVQHEMRAFAGDYLVYLVQEHPRHRVGPQNPVKTDRTILRGPSAYGFGAIRRWRRYIASCSDDDPIFGLWKKMFRMDRTDFEPQLEHHLKASKSLNSILRATILRSQPKSMIQLARCYGQELEKIYAQATERSTTETEGFNSVAQKQLHQVLFGANSPAKMLDYESIDCFSLDEHVEYRRVLGEVEKVALDFNAIPGRAMLLRERDMPIQPFVFLRGQPNRLGERVARRLPALLSHLNPNEFSKSSGRAELAKAIVDPRNPLTARVIVNRIWAWHFGQPLVASPSDFGTRCPEPKQADLLDHLAWWLVANEWSLKKLHRYIMTSSTYRQASTHRSEPNRVDPANSLLWRYPSRRLEFEAIRDSLLAVSGQLDEYAGGKPINMAPDNPQATCRTIFLKIDRQNISRFARNFDFPSPDFTIAGRPITSVPQQSLFFLNSPFVIEQARKIAAEFSAEKGAEVTQVTRMFRRILGRDPSSIESQTAGDYVRQQTNIPAASVVEKSVWKYGYGEYKTSKEQLISFSELPFANSRYWQGGRAWPDSHLHYLRLTPTGGHVGIDHQHAAVRRWTAPAGGMVNIHGRLSHVPDAPNCGDGIRAWIVVDKKAVASFALHDQSTTANAQGIRVKQGMTIDFIVDCGANHLCDLFEWAPKITMTDKQNLKTIYDAKLDFRGKPIERLGSWEKLAHALLQSNEFVYLK